MIDGFKTLKMVVSHNDVFGAIEVPVSNGVYQFRFDDMEYKLTISDYNSRAKSMRTDYSLNVYRIMAYR